MKKLLIWSLLSGLLLANEGDKYVGFLGLKSCVEEGLFLDCPLERYSRENDIVAVIDGDTYSIDRQQLGKILIDQAIMKNNVSFYGTIESKVLKLNNITYEKPAKTFFKGCI